jgi:hypothetical protein
MLLRLFLCVISNRRPCGATFQKVANNLSSACPLTSPTRGEGILAPSLRWEGLEEGT